MEKGRTFWITGLSGAGKTTLGKLLYKHIHEVKSNVVLLDGDILREIYGNQNYSSDARKMGSYVDARLCRALNEQEIDVVICVMDMFDEVRKWNRDNIENYYEIYLKVPIEELIRRDQKQLYSRALRNEISNVMGINMEFEEPKEPDMIFDNYGINSPETVLEKIVTRFNL